MNKLTQKDIEKLVNDIYNWLTTYEMDGDLCIYYKNKRINTYGDIPKTEEGIFPDEYCEYAPWDNIITITSEGRLCNYYNTYYEMPKELVALWEALGLYYESNTSWCWSLYPIDEMEVEYYPRGERPKEPIYIYLGKGGVDSRLERIMQYWYDMGQTIGDEGCCVIGEKMSFVLEGQPYQMAPVTGFQGEGSWVPFVSTIKSMLKDIGATDIEWNCGRMD